MTSSIWPPDEEQRKEVRGVGPEPDMQLLTAVSAAGRRCSTAISGGSNSPTA